MSVPLTIELPENLAAKVRAAAGSRRVEDVVVDWVALAATERPVHTLSNEEVVALADMMLPEVESDALHDLLDKQAEGELTPADRVDLDRRLAEYGRGQVRKAQALVEAVGRGLKPRLDRSTS